MPDESTHSATSPESEPGKRIKIGSQRAEQVDSNAKTDAATSAEAIIGPSDRQDPPSPEALAPQPTSMSTEAELKGQAETAEVEVAPPAASEASGDITTPGSLDVHASEEDLEREIAAALENVALDDLMASEVKMRPDDVELEFDQRYQATVAKIYRESVLFELPGQRNGVVPLKQFAEPPEPGSTLEVVVVGFSDDDQLYELIVPGASVEVSDWSDLAEGVVVKAKITGHNKGGLECEVNHIRGFIPASQVSLYRVEDFAIYVDEQLPCVVIEANPERRNLVLSHRAVLEREQEEAREKLLSELAVGQIREGVVTSLQKFGAFVDLGGIDGLIHISQLSWDHIRDPSEVMEKGQHVKVRIEKIDEITGKIGLSYRDLMHNPWERVDEKYPVGGVVKGIVSKLMDFGAFVKLEPGVEGLVHISELSYKRVTRVSHVVEEGQEVEVKVLTIDPGAQRIGLSIKAAEAVAEAANDEQAEGSDEAQRKRASKRPAKPLRGGVGGSSGGETFGLKW